MVSIEVKEEVVHGLSNGINKFDPRWALEVKGRGQTLKTLKSNISSTVRDREMVSIEDFDVERLKTLRDKKCQ